MTQLQADYEALRREALLRLPSLTVDEEKPLREECLRLDKQLLEAVATINRLRDMVFSMYMDRELAL
jgi:hypothetical protein